MAYARSTRTHVIDTEMPFHELHTVWVCLSTYIGEGKYYSNFNTRELSTETIYNSFAAVLANIRGPRDPPLFESRSNRGENPGMYSFPRPRSQTQERVHSRFSPFTLSTTATDVIYGYSDYGDPPRVRMSCGHFVSPTNLYGYCLMKLEDTSTTCELCCPKCNRIWEYSEVREAALLTLDECKYFESLLSKNYMKKMMDINCCPRCKLVCERKNRDTVIANCPACTRYLGRPYKFCWNCGREWSGPRSARAQNCAHPNCEHPSMKAVRNAKMVTKFGCTFPNIRACPTCGGIVEHTITHCKFATCPQCQMSYCFLCLRSESECLKTRPHSWYTPCAIPVKRIQTEIPRWIQ